MTFSFFFILGHLKDSLPSFGSPVTVILLREITGPGPGLFALAGHHIATFATFSYFLSCP